MLIISIVCSCVFYGDLYPNEECYDEATAHGVASLLRIRKEYAFGPLKDIFLHQNCIGFSRSGTAEKPGCVVVLSNAPEDSCVPPLTDMRRTHLSLGRVSIALSV